jgi:hypothetical protein
MLTTLTTDEIIEMARQAGYKDLPTVRLAFQGFDKIAFAKLVAEAEREACAKYVEECSLPDAYSEACLPEIADEIRARGQHE